MRRNNDMVDTAVTRFRSPTKRVCAHTCPLQTGTEEHPSDYRVQGAGYACVLMWLYRGTLGMVWRMVLNSCFVSLACTSRSNYNVAFIYKRGSLKATTPFLSCSTDASGLQQLVLVVFVQFVPLQTDPRACPVPFSQQLRRVLIPVLGSF